MTKVVGAELVGFPDSERRSEKDEPSPSEETWDGDGDVVNAADVDAWSADEECELLNWDEEAARPGEQGLSEGEADVAGARSWLPFVVVAVLTVLTSGSSILMRYVRMIPSENQFLPQTAVVAAEVLKAALCAGRILAEHGTLSTSFDGWKEIAKSSVPALLYLVQNNASYLAANYISATAQMMIFQSKFLFTAALSVIVLGRSYKTRQWLALLLLTAGVLVVHRSDADVAKTRSSEPLDVTRGASLCLVAVVSSVLAGVYFERLLKGGSRLDVWQQNLSLSLVSVAIGLAGLACAGELPAGARGWGGLLQGFTATTWACVALQALRGLVVAVVIQFTDCSMKNITGAAATILTALLSSALFGTPVTLLLVVGSAIVIFSVCWYQRA